MSIGQLNGVSLSRVFVLWYGCAQFGTLPPSETSRWGDFRIEQDCLHHDGTCRRFEEREPAETGIAAVFWSCYQNEEQSQPDRGVAHPKIKILPPVTRKFFGAPPRPLPSSEFQPASCASCAQPISGAGSRFELMRKYLRPRRYTCREWEHIIIIIFILSKVLRFSLALGLQAIL